MAACLITASVTWMIAKWQYKRIERSKPPHENLWKIAFFTLIAIWALMTIYKWIKKWINWTIELIRGIDIAQDRIRSQIEFCQSKSGKGYNRVTARERAAALGYGVTVTDKQKK